MFSDKLRGFSADTAVVSLLLAIELGRLDSALSIDGGLIAITLLAVSLIPFFLTADGPSFSGWLFGRAAIVALGLIAGSFLSGSASFVPMSLLIFAGLASCMIQFYMLFKLRPAD